MEGQVAFHIPQADLGCIIGKGGVGIPSELLSLHIQLLLSDWVDQVGEHGQERKSEAAGHQKQTP